MDDRGSLYVVSELNLFYRFSRELPAADQGGKRTAEFRLARRIAPARSRSSRRSSGSVNCCCQSSSLPRRSGPLAERWGRARLARRRRAGAEQPDAQCQGGEREFR